MKFFQLGVGKVYKSKKKAGHVFLWGEGCPASDCGFKKRLRPWLWEGSSACDGG